LAASASLTAATLSVIVLAVWSGSTPPWAVPFFREDTWGNAYVIVGRMVWEAVAR
jgi:hypothetical protein